MKIVSLFLWVFSVFYPLTIVFYPNFTPFVVILLAFLWGIKFIFSKKCFDVLVSGYFILVYFLFDLKFYYPVIINLAMFLLFFVSLRKVPIITQIAQLKDNLDEKGLKYTKNLTMIWCYFFVLNGFISFVLVFIDEVLWAIYCGIVSYILVGALFFGEILYRKVVLKV